MDSVRFGKALGVGAREAARALARAADAAASPNPSAKASPIAQRASQTTQRAVRNTVQTTRGVREGSRRFGEAVWGPTARLTGVLWLEVMGVFFSLFAITGLGYCWSHRAVFHSGSPTDRRSFYVMAIMAAVFSYFCISSFLRARIRSRR
jgi:hypothetical protein